MPRNDGRRNRRRVETERQEPLWPAFEEWADDKGIDLTSREEWFDYWDAFAAGAEAVAIAAAE